MMAFNIFKNWNNHIITPYLILKYFYTYVSTTNLYNCRITLDVSDINNTHKPYIRLITKKC